MWIEVWLVSVGFEFWVSGVGVEGCTLDCVSNGRNLVFSGKKDRYSCVLFYYKRNVFVLLKKMWGKVIKKKM